jgi:hypothetical protein
VPVRVTSSPEVNWNVFPGAAASALVCVARWTEPFPDVCGMVYMIILFTSMCCLV